VWEKWTFSLYTMEIHLWSVEIIQWLVNIFNSKFKYGKCSELHAYSMNLEQQNKINIMSAFINEIRVGKRCLMQFQKDFIMQ